ncbi:MAG: hypothetical protein P8010_04015 [Desulfosarcinaceae bacterium]
MFQSNPKRSLDVCLKILGLMLTAGGIWMACSALASAFNPPNYAELLARIDLPPAIKSALEGMQPQRGVVVRQVMATFLIQGILPILLGAYLMRFGGWFKRSGGRSRRLGERSFLRRFFLPRMSLALASIEEEAERGYQPFTLGS